MLKCKCMPRNILAVSKLCGDSHKTKWLLLGAEDLKVHIFFSFCRQFYIMIYKKTLKMIEKPSDATAEVSERERSSSEARVTRMVISP